MNREPVYLDNQASTPIDPRVLEVMMPFLTRQYANCSSPHLPGRRAAEALASARRQVQTFLRTQYDTEIVFTSGATEANHLAIIGTALAGPRPRNGHIVTTAIEHSSVLSACEQLTTAGFAITTVTVGRDGRVDPADIAAAIKPETVLVSVMHANNEIGTIQPISEIAAVAHGHGTLLHVDAVQAVASCVMNVNDLDADLLTISAHKIYGPKGTGALYVRRGTPLHPHYPGSQEYGRRAGTANLAGAAGLAEALRLLTDERDVDLQHISGLRDALAERLVASIPDAHINGSRHYRLPGNLSLTIPGIDASDIVGALPEVALATGSACTSGDGKPSHVLTAIGLGPKDARATIRLSLGRFTTDDEIAYAASRLIKVVKRLRTSSQGWPNQSRTLSVSSRT